MRLYEYLVALRSHYATSVTVVLTAAATRMVVPASIAMYCDQVVTDEDAFTPTANHMQLATWAQQVLVLPATANTLGQAAAGLAPNLLTTLVLAHSEPVVFVPNMNPRMWGSAVVRRNVATLRDLGHQVVEPISKLAWEAGLGRLVTAPVMPSPAQLVDRLRTQHAAAAGATNSADCADGGERAVAPGERTSSSTERSAS